MVENLSSALLVLTAAKLFPIWVKSTATTWWWPIVPRCHVIPLSDTTDGSSSISLIAANSTGSAAITAIVGDGDIGLIVSLEDSSYYALAGSVRKRVRPQPCRRTANTSRPRRSMAFGKATFGEQVDKRLPVEFLLVAAMNRCPCRPQLNCLKCEGLPTRLGCRSRTIFEPRALPRRFER